MRDRPDACRGCPAWEDGEGFVEPAGPTDASIALIGQGPGADEAWTGVPFTGPSGRTLDRWLTRAGIYRHKVWIGNIVQCHLKGNRAPRREEVAFCRKVHWGTKLKALSNLKVIVAVGVPAMKVLANEKANSDWTGTVFEHDGTYALGITHPAAILRGAWEEEPACVVYLRRARQIAERGCWEILDPTAAPEGAILYPTLEDLRVWASEIGPNGISVDIETAGRHIILVGLCRVDDLVPTIVHFLRHGGDPYWPQDEWESVRSWLADLLADPLVPKAFHNGSFDITILKHWGFVVGGYTFDTLLAQHIAYAEMPKALEFCAKLYNGTGGWKHVVKKYVDEDEGEHK